MAGVADNIERHKTAIRRKEMSLPVRCLLRDGLVSPETSVFDFGCGHGADVKLLNAKEISCSGWDPSFCPAEPKRPADVVNLGYVINVIEDAQERAATLRDAWELCGKLIVISARVNVDGRGYSKVTFGDGIVTGIGTFQKYFTQAELREYIETELGTEALPAAPGVFYVFRDEELRQRFIASRYRRRQSVPRKRVSEIRFEENKDVLEPLIVAITDLGRLPHADEFELAHEAIERFGSLKRAFALIRRVTGGEEWDKIRQCRTEDLKVYLALARFGRRPPISKLPLALQRDIREFFRTYKRACQTADELLFRAGDPEAIDDACKRSSIGKLLPNALYVHRSALETLEPLLRVYEGCARAYLGEIEDTNIVKLHRFSGKVSYLAYPDFDTDPHPALVRSVKLSLRSLELACYDYSESDNPPILHRKETFLTVDHPLHEKFARLTQQEEKHGLLDDASTIGYRAGWETRLAEVGFRLAGHRLVRRKE